MNGHLQTSRMVCQKPKKACEIQSLKTAVAPRAGVPALRSFKDLLRLTSLSALIEPKWLFLVSANPKGGRRAS